MMLATKIIKLLRNRFEESITFEVKEFKTISGVKKYCGHVVGSQHRYVELMPQSFGPILDSFLVDSYGIPPREFYDIPVGQARSSISKMIIDSLKAYKTTSIKIPIQKNKNVQINLVFS